MEMNHPSFLARLVPHVFHNRHHPRQTMPEFRPPSAMTLDSADPVTTSTERTSTQQPVNDVTVIQHSPPPCYIDRGATHLLSAVYRGNPKVAMSLLTHYHRTDPEAAASTLASFVTGNQNDREILGLLLVGMFETDEEVAKSKMANVMYTLSSIPKSSGS